MAGLGAAMFTGEVGRGDSVAVFGCGGVGDAAIAGARLAGASKIIAVDLDARKLELAEAFGATHTVDASTVDPVEAIRALTDGYGADVCIEAVGNPKVLEQAFYARDLAGTVVQVGVPDPEMRIDLPDDRLLRPGRPAQAVVVRRLPPEPGLPDADRPLPAGPARPRPLRQRDHRASTGSRRRSTAWSGARCCARSSSSVEGRWRASTGSSPAASSRSTARTSTSTTTSGSSATTTRCW